MKVYQLKLILGKESQYDKDGKLKNQCISPKYSGDKELEDMMEDNNWRKVGACEVSCVKVFDTITGKEDNELMKSVNQRISDNVKAAEKPKTIKDLLEEQTAKNEALLKRLEALESINPKTEKEIRAELFAAAAKLELNPAKNIKTEELKKLVDC